MDKKIILIGGAPMAGKTFVAQKLLEKFGTPWISTDTIRDFIRELVPKEKYPIFWEFDGNVEEYVDKHSPQEIFENHHRQSLAVWEGIEIWINKTHTWQSYVIEGVAIIPQMVKGNLANDPRIKPIFLYDNNRDRILDVIHTRGVWNGALQYPDKFNEKYVEWVLIFNEWIKKECEKYGYPLIEVGDRSTLLERVLNYI